MRETLINNFLRISKIPRMSGNEKQISDFFVEVAKNNHLDFFQDSNYNVLIKKKGNIKGDSIAFQSHLDMVCVKKESSNHDFSKGIDVIIDGDKVTAKDTSLGADQGVGLALMLTLIEDNTLKHPDLEFLFTVEEETTFKGALTFPYDKVVSRKMINLDFCEDDGTIVSSAGDDVSEYVYEGTLSKKNLNSYKLKIDGLIGGNSGIDIERSRNNAIINMISILSNKNIYLCSINGGTFENDIATSCEAVVQSESDLTKEISNIKVEKVENSESFSLEDTKNIINEILAMKSGFITETASANLGMIKTDNNKVIVTYLFRSTIKPELEEISNNLNNLKYNFKINNLYTDNIWKINENSLMLKKYKETYFKLFKENPRETIIQGGVEISAIQEKINNLDLISIGANMQNFHTINEVTYISSWEKIYNILINVINK